MAQSEFDSEKVDVRVNEITAEVTTRYQVDEGQTIDMVIRLPPSYPLLEVKVIGSKRLAVTPERWNKWMLTCTVACKVPLSLWRPKLTLRRMGRLWMR
jgi:hypothetical protein